MSERSPPSDRHPPAVELGALQGARTIVDESAVDKLWAQSESKQRGILGRRLAASQATDTDAPVGAAVGQRLAELDARQGMYIAASGTLTQFNAIVVAVHGSALTMAEAGALKAMMAVALLAHVVAALVLCWAARPVGGPAVQTATMALAEGRALIDDTFRNYRRGWRMTLTALVVSAGAAVVFVLQAAGVPKLN